jgi:hypothetical protein
MADQLGNYSRAQRTISSSLMRDSGGIRDEDTGITIPERGLTRSSTRRSTRSQRRKNAR